MPRLCGQIKDVVKPDAVSLSCIKGLQDSSEIKLISTLIQEELGTECSVLMGANIANEVYELRALYLIFSLFNSFNNYSK